MPRAATEFEFRRGSFIPLHAFSGAEQRGADADNCRAFFDGDFEIAAHAHAQLGQGGAERLAGVFGEFAQLPEDGARVFGVRGPRGHRHQPVDFEAGQGVDPVQLGGQFVGVIPEFAGLAREIHFEQNGHGPAGLVGAFADFLRDMQAVHALNGCKKFDGIAAFVGLQMADEMPAHVARAQGDFRPGLLDFILAEEGEAEPGGFRHDLRRLAFGDREQGHGGGVAPGAVAGGANALLN
jgi:hypothetical protein